MLPNADVRDLGRLLKDKAYQVFYKDGMLYAFKGFTGKIGPIFVHASMLLIMAGAHLEFTAIFRGLFLESLQVPCLENVQSLLLLLSSLLSLFGSYNHCLMPDLFVCLLFILLFFLLLFLLLFLLIILRLF
jgi:hypothetical protein